MTGAADVLATGILAILAIGAAAAVWWWIKGSVIGMLEFIGVRRNK